MGPREFIISNHGHLDLQVGLDSSLPHRYVDQRQCACETLVFVFVTKRRCEYLWTVICILCVVCECVVVGQSTIARSRERLRRLLLELDINATLRFASFRILFQTIPGCVLCVLCVI